MSVDCSVFQWTQAYCLDVYSTVRLTGNVFPGHILYRLLYRG